MQERSVLFRFFLALLLIFATRLAVAQSATVKDEIVPVVSDATRPSRTAAELHRGEEVQIEISLMLQDGEWCYIRSRAPNVTAGYVRCDSLERPKPKPLLPRAAAVPVSADAAKAWSDCEHMNLRSFVERVNLTSDQQGLVDQAAEESGLHSCSTRASGFIREYQLDPTRTRKWQLLRGWSKSDPYNSCVQAARLFWKKVRPILTQEQRAKVAVQMTELAERVAEVQQHPETCSPIFCMY